MPNCRITIARSQRRLWRKIGDNTRCAFVAACLLLNTAPPTTRRKEGTFRKGSATAAHVVSGCFATSKAKLYLGVLRARRAHGTSLDESTTTPGLRPQCLNGYQETVHRHAQVSMKGILDSFCQNEEKGTLRYYHPGCLLVIQHVLDAQDDPIVHLSCIRCRFPSLQPVLKRVPKGPVRLLHRAFLERTATPARVRVVVRTRKRVLGSCRTSSVGILTFLARGHEWFSWGRLFQRIGLMSGCRPILNSWTSLPIRYHTLTWVTMPWQASFRSFS